MTRLRLTRDVRFLDTETDSTFLGEGEYDVPDEDTERLLDWSCWERVEDTDDTDNATDGSESNEDEQGTLSEQPDDSTDEGPSDDDLREFLSGSINGDILPALRDGEYSESLSRLVELEEQRDEPRKTVLEKLRALQE